LSSFRNYLLWLPALVLLSACASRAPQPEVQDSEQRYSERTERLLGWQAWSLTGRIGVNRGDEGGSGRLDWSVRDETSRLAFRGTLGQGAWRLDVTPDLARLELKDGTVREAPRVEDLVLDQTGWEAPVTALSWWVRGLVWPGGPAPTERQLNDDGTLALLRQAGWQIGWTRYSERDESLLLPSRLELTRDDVSIKLAISRWANTPGAATAASGNSGND
jgi:outer membrane lipoprotein LolB